MKIKNTFTLLEITVCIAILSLTASLIGWRISKMVSTHQFYKTMDTFTADLRKTQLICLADRIECELRIHRNKDYYEYSFHTDEPIFHFHIKKTKLSGVKEIRKKEKKIDIEVISISREGRIDPQEVYFFSHDQDIELMLDLQKPLLLELKRLQTSN